MARALFERFTLDGREFPGIGVRLHWLLPSGKGEREASAAFCLIPTTRQIVYKDFHDCSDAASLGFKPELHTPTFPLGVVYAASITGKLVRLLEGELAIWCLRMVIDLGLVEPPPLPEGLRADAPEDPDEAVVCEGFKLNWECHELYKPGQEIPMSWRFTERWCGIPQKRAGEALQRLANRQLLTLHETEKGARTACRFSFGPKEFEKAKNADGNAPIPIQRVKARLGRRGRAAG